MSLRKYRVYYYSASKNDWEYDTVRLYPKYVKQWLQAFEAVGFQHAYEVPL